MCSLDEMYTVGIMYYLNTPFSSPLVTVRLLDEMYTVGIMYYLNTPCLHARNVTEGTYTLERFIIISLRRS